jgi:SEC-C motif-containing protein
MRCPCLSGLRYDECCEHFHAGSTALTAEALMRSRFSAFALGLPEYLLETWHASTRPVSLQLDADIQWYRLDVISTVSGSPHDPTGTVEFEAFYRGATNGSQRENSSFVRERGRWFYFGEEALRG